MPRKDGQSWLADGQVSFYGFLNYFDRDDLLDRKRNFSTLSGLIIEQTRHIPKAGEHVEWNGFRFEVVDMGGARIDKILLTPCTPQEIVE